MTKNTQQCVHWLPVLFMSWMRSLPNGDLVLGMSVCVTEQSCPRLLFSNGVFSQSHTWEGFHLPVLSTHMGCSYCL